MTAERIPPREAGGPGSLESLAIFQLDPSHSYYERRSMKDLDSHGSLYPAEAGTLLSDVQPILFQVRTLNAPFPNAHQGEALRMYDLRPVLWSKVRMCLLSAALIDTSWLS